MTTSRPLLLASLFLGWTLTVSSVSGREITVEVPVARGEVTLDAQGTPALETVRVPAAIGASLKDATFADRVLLADFPTAPGQREDLVLERFEPYAKEARIQVLASDREPYEIPRSSRRHFLGHSLDGTTRVGVHLDPDSGAVTGLAIGSFGTTEFVLADEAQPLLLDVRDAAFGSEFLETACGGDQLPLPAEAALRAATPPALLQRGAPGTEYELVVAVDTDNELHHLRFGNNTTTATNWLADLFTAMNVYYNRDVSLNLVQGDTTFRLDTDPSPTYDDDPWTVTGSGASSSHLNEFGAYWSANMGAVDRVFAMLLSGKSGNDFSTSGIAWVDGYCETQTTGGGYSVTQTYKFTTSVVDSGARVIAHEIGHNAGSPHTHCYSPPVDECYHLEGGCFSGTPSCPAPEGNGTIMSYCHFSNGANCGSSRNEFHPTVVALFDSYLTSHSPSCVTSGNGEIFSDGFESGNTSMW